MGAHEHRGGRYLIGQRGLLADLGWLSAVLIALSRLPRALWTVPRETPAASATAVRLNCLGPSRRSVAVVTASKVGETDRSGFSGPARI